MNPGIPALSEDKETSLSPIYPSTGAPWSPQHEWPADVFPVGTPFPEYPVAYPEEMAHIHVDPQAPRHTVAVCGQAGCNSDSTVIPELQVDQGLGLNAVLIPETVHPYNAAIHQQPFDYTQNQPTEGFSPFLMANGISAPTTPHGQASYSLNTGALAGVAPIWPDAPQLPSYQNHCHDAAPQNIHAQQLAIDPRLTYAPPQGQRRAATGMRAVRRTEPYPTSHVAATRAAHVNAMFTTAAMAQSFAAAAQHGGHDAFDTNSSLQFNNVQEQMIASLPRSVQISGNTARRRYSSASSGYLSSGSSHYPTTPTSDMPPGMPYGPVSVVSPTQHIPAAYNDWSIQMPSLAAPQPQVFMSTLYAMNEPFSYARHGTMAPMANIYEPLATPTLPDPSVAPHLPAAGATGGATGGLTIDELEEEDPSASSQRTKNEKTQKENVEVFRAEPSAYPRQGTKPRGGKALKEKTVRSKTSGRRQEHAAVNIGPRCLTPSPAGPSALPSREESGLRTEQSLEGVHQQPDYEAERRGVGRGGAGETKVASEVGAGERFPCPNAWNGCRATFSKKGGGPRHRDFGACKHMPTMDVGSIRRWKCNWPGCNMSLSRSDALYRHERDHARRQEEKRLARENESGRNI